MRAYRHLEEQETALTLKLVLKSGSPKNIRNSHDEG